MSRGGAARGSLPWPCPCPLPADRQCTCWHLIPLALTRRKAPLRSAGLKAPAVISLGGQEEAWGGSPRTKGRQGGWEAPREAEPSLEVVSGGLHLP